MNKIFCVIILFFSIGCAAPIPQPLRPAGPANHKEFMEREQQERQEEMRKVDRESNIKMGY